MDNKKLMNGNETIGEAAIRAGCRFFFGYPITPQSELPAYMARRLPEVGGVFLQAESEVSAINMVYGASGAGARVMTSSSSPGISLKQEGISYLAGSDLPCVIVNIMRGGPGLAGIQPAQSDYFQSTRGGGHGDYRHIVLAPYNLQEIVDLTALAFDLADIYRMPVLIVGDGMLGQMMEPVNFEHIERRETPDKDWAIGSDSNSPKNIITSLNLNTPELEKENLQRNERYKKISSKEVIVKTYKMSDAEVAIVAYGTVARIVKNVIKEARRKGLPLGLIRPVTLWPFPSDIFDKYCDQVKTFLTVEMSMGQMVEDVRLALSGRSEVCFYGRTGGMVPTPAEILDKVEEIFEVGDE